jgi:hypothetical protein
MTKPSVFISHLWTLELNFERLKIKLDTLGYSYHIYNIPQHDPYDYYGKRKIEQDLENQLQEYDVLLVFAKLTFGNAFWAVKEVEYALKSNKMIIGTIPTDYDKHPPLFIQTASDFLFPFDDEAIIKTLENYSKSN